MDKFNSVISSILQITGFIIAWFNRTAKGVIRTLSGLNFPFNKKIDQVKNSNTFLLSNNEIAETILLQRINRNGEPKTKAEFVANVNKALEGSAVERFFKKNPKFISDLAEKAASLADHAETPICNQELFPKTAQVTMHQQVLYCDDSVSMRNGHRGENRWDAQNQLINRIARVTTYILPEGEGVYLRYINQEIPNADSLSFQETADVIEPLKPDGDTPIGTNLKKKILEPLVYNKLPNDLERPLLISVITDGDPSREPRSTFVNAIVECGQRLQKAGLPRESVKFLVGQVGSATGARTFLNEVTNDPRIASVVFVASERFDAPGRLGNDTNMDEWLIETLYAPIMKSQS
ncbi:unnamed protein product [Clonostachys rosea]|uniref:VWFA domain-containing protein n=1 Tax=Bionectria ochroleuca TaxID=29856 RepID=A0ABY6UTJ6_BIOOC|nr:unnamed protein product [Clonostachys rosea]